MNLGKTAHAAICRRENEGGIDVARIELDGATLRRDRRVPTSKPPLDKTNRFHDIKVIWKALFSLLEFLEPPGEIKLPEIAIVTKSKVSFRQVGVKRERAIEGILS